MDNASWGLIIAFLVQFGGVVWWGSSLTQRVKALSDKKPCEACILNEKVIRLDERAAMVRDIAVAVAAARKDWDVVTK
jgi:uncharacterized Rmd1/YagE family protein